jgi:PadR family transcriptional regulator, regulatory protein PadR
MKEKPDVLQGTLALVVRKTLDVPAPQHGCDLP